MGKIESAPYRRLCCSPGCRTAQRDSSRKSRRPSFKRLCFPTKSHDYLDLSPPFLQFLRVRLARTSRFSFYIITRRYFEEEGSIVNDEGGGREGKKFGINVRGEIYSNGKCCREPEIGTLENRAVFNCSQEEKGGRGRKW